MRISENLENKILSNRYFLDQLIHLKFLQNHLWNATLIRFYSETKTSSESLYYCESLREYSFVVALKGNHILKGFEGNFEGFYSIYLVLPMYVNAILRLWNLPTKIIETGSFFVTYFELFLDYFYYIFHEHGSTNPAEIINVVTYDSLKMPVTIPGKIGLSNLLIAASISGNYSLSTTPGSGSITHSIYSLP